MMAFINNFFSSLTRLKNENKIIIRLYHYIKMSMFLKGNTTLTSYIKIASSSVKSTFILTLKIAFLVWMFT